MESDCREYPCLRPVEAIPDRTSGRVVLRDPTQLAAGVLMVGQEQLLLLSLMDGSRRRVEIQGAFARHLGKLLLSAELDDLLDQLAGAGFLDGPGFEKYYEGLVEEFRSSPFRPLRDPDGFGAPAAGLREYLDECLCGANGERPNGLGLGLGLGPERRTPNAERPTPNARLAGIVTPHLDYARGWPCYGDGYRAFRRDAGAPKRVVVLGTNHFGRSRSVVALSKDFQTPWGVVPVDRDFLGRLEAECGGDLFPYELDHLREHSIELQAVWLHHLLGDGFRMVAALCPDPSGPRGTEAGDPEGVDLREFARALGELIRRDAEPTLVVASADLSHVGRYFGDERSLTDSWLRNVRETDEAALAHLDRNDPEGFRSHMAATQNPTRVCSVGCLYALMVALGPEATPRRLRYHQAVTRELENGVTCAAYAFYA